MNITLPNIETVECDETSNSTKNIVFDTSTEEYLAIRIKREKKETTCIILEKDQLIKFRNILTCIIDSDVIQPLDQ